MNISLAPEILFNIGSFAVTNSYFWSVILGLLLIGSFMIIRKRLKPVPGTVQGLSEVLLEGAYGFVRSITGSDAKTRRVFPLVFTMFIFILSANLWSFIPGQAAVAVNNGEGNLPLFRAIMADYSLVFMMTLITVIVAQTVAIYVAGPFGYMGKFINLGGFRKFFKSLGDSEKTAKQKIGILSQAGLDFFLGFMDIIGELAKVVSLSFRLFGNMFAGEVLASVMFFIGFSVINFGFMKISVLAATGNIFVTSLIYMPFMLLGLLTALVQAFVFSILTLIFITMASETEAVSTKESEN